ncbi:Glutamate--tRNA ligase 2 [Candidatus Xenohaliotis californiensis]|uniref:Glutamate--tRNA ligase n=1 Tax=Candidatus Xenohaliotis californiensis TaxID=84677 RepID=A0ABP0EXF7_9RICK|nr:Glutamate--tRNA ligase 2 [Candidatus Xenohaliotis californiensis]
MQNLKDKNNINQIITRFAPSPTGFLHLGNARTALLCWLYARTNNGKFILRIDDTDKERCSREYEDAIYKELKWLGLNWDFSEKQSNQNDAFSEKVTFLKKQGFLYPCYETKEELELKRKHLICSGLPPIYNREALKLTDSKKRQYEDNGQKPHWRFKMSYDKPIVWHDLVRGEVKFNPTKISDPIVIRSNGVYTYLLISVISDILHGITDIIRGEDHITNTALQIQMFESLGVKQPKLAHLSLISPEEGKISKRKGVNEYSLSSLRNNGILPLAIINYLTAIGHSHYNCRLYCSIKEIVKNFDIRWYGGGLTKINVKDIYQVNTKVIHNTHYSEICSRLSSDLSARLSSDKWNLLCANINNINEISAWLDILDGLLPVSNVLDRLDKELLNIALEKIPNNWLDKANITMKSVGLWINLIGITVGKKGKNLFLPLRLAITGKENGPEIFKIIQILGVGELKSRIENCILKIKE